MTMTAEAPERVVAWVDEEYSGRIGAVDTCGRYWEWMAYERQGRRFWDYGGIPWWYWFGADGTYRGPDAYGVGLSFEPRPTLPGHARVVPVEQDPPAAAPPAAPEGGSWAVVDLSLARPGGCCDVEALVGSYGEARAYILRSGRLRHLRPALLGPHATRQARAGLRPPMADVTLYEV